MIFLVSAGAYAKFRSRSHDAVICIYDLVGDMFDTHEHASDAVKCCF